MGAVYYPSPPYVINQMLSLGRASSSSIVYDLGCGDGSIVMAAARDFRVKKAVGIEIDKKLSTIASSMVSKLKNAVIINASYDIVDISEANLITIYQGAAENARLKHKFIDELKEGSVIVSHEFGIPGWRPVQFHVLKNGKHYYRIFIYMIQKNMNQPIQTDSKSNQ
ncbi:MAG: SAM-dependent methyltransferase [Nitrososphaerota archaeon]|jgi:16S rRNA A1518/A1519 N6-dimethyltransferase RsmA/KsgA/DIM1 with predicted DNA glycosylase/AP lyase activity|nr:SAM-dependent methyltransferase [Nitrososphaerota archaeon]MDG6926859.1 SAM-dependent methyltransferase [Nitrososphaerota archaeon]MDG6930023.1 SAM-dependent methyltransferase [Nitrososphaerota archaeon]MDG6931974.1 SAM-dependent methyltransferase [Nitrososphaerota archaeon]MDG6943823.1 SAM-dependent methyltransferase [Nitrososphaerota archaeon]